MIAQQHIFEHSIEIPTVVQENIPTHVVSTIEVLSGAQSRNNNGISEYRLQMEKPSLPKFSGVIREYATFKSGFKHNLEARYGKRESLTILRSTLHGKPLDMIKGIGLDYDAAWEYLDSIWQPKIC